MTWKPSPSGGCSVTTPPLKVLNRTPASPYPILIEDFIKLYNNITNPYTYNTREDPNWEYHTTLRKEFMKIIKKRYRGF